ncbi:MAG TPA: M6 family metalloprotease domain-containing protein [Polyangiaceae bacterium]|nr:M6 family metalloprotease domain-containing protein [Polyangiaceae bacterium]
MAASLLAGAWLTLGAPAAATIVWEGKEVPAWPDLPERAPAAGNARFAQLGTQLFPHPSGVVRGLTILVDFSDQAAAYTKADVDAWLNQQGYKQFGLDGSVRDYYFGQSSGKVDYQNDVHGFYRAKKAKSYYQGGTSYERADELWAEVIAALDAEIDFSTFDNDGDGNTEAISLLYAGDEGTFGKGLWPHAGGSNERRDGVKLNRYMMTAMNDKPTNYVFSHESGHMLFGWPDLYGVGDYCIMANRGSDTNPVGINDMFRADQGWIDIVDVDASTNARLSTVPDGAVYRFLNPARPTEYFLWSNLQKAKEWSFVAGSGLLVWHFDRSINGNNPPDPLQLAVVQAGGSRELAATTWPSPGSAATDLFSKNGNAELAAQTKPNTKWNDGSASGLRIYDISAPGPTMEFSVGTGPLPPTSSGGTSSGGSASGGSGGNASGGTSAGGMSVGGAPLGGQAGGATGGAGGVAAGGANAGAPTQVAGTPSSSSGSGSIMPTLPAVAVTSADSSGCSCRSAARSPFTATSLVALAGAVLFVARRRQRHDT